MKLVKCGECYVWDWTFLSKYLFLRIGLKLLCYNVEALSVINNQISQLSSYICFRLTFSNNPFVSYSQIDYSVHQIYSGFKEI